MFKMFVKLELHAQSVSAAFQTYTSLNTKKMLLKIYYNARTLRQVELEQKKLEEGILKQRQLEQRKLEQGQPRFF